MTRTNNRGAFMESCFRYAVSFFTVIPPRHLLYHYVSAFSTATPSGLLVSSPLSTLEDSWHYLKLR